MAKNENEEASAGALKQQHVEEGIQKAIDLVEELGRGSKGLPLTPGFIAHRLRQLKRGEL